MEFDQDKVDDMVLALLALTMFNEHGATRAWKGQDWETMERLYQKGFISDPKSKARSVYVTEDGIKRSRELFEKHFAKR